MDFKAIEIEMPSVLSDEDAEKLLQAQVGDDVIVSITRMTRAEYQRQYGPPADTES